MLFHVQATALLAARNGRGDFMRARAWRGVAVRSQLGRTFLRRSCVVCCVLALSACVLPNPPAREDLAKEAAPNLIPPAQWVAPGGVGGTVPDNWLASWNDPALNALVAEALAYNTDLRTAAARVDLAAAYLRAAASPLYPQVNLMARGGGQMGGDTSGLQGVGLFATWELDLWGRVRAEKTASEVQYESAQLDAAYARQSIAALVAKAWVLAIEARLAKAQAEEMQKSSEQLASLSGDRLRVGSGDEYEVAVAQANVELSRDTVRRLALAYDDALRALEALVGRYPAANVMVAATLPRWPGEVPVGLCPPNFSNDARTWLRQSVALQQPSTAREEAKAARLPRISLVANFTSLSSEMFVLKSRDNPIFSAGADLMQPIFLGGYLQSQVDARTAEQKAAIADYGKVMSRVFGEVEGALSTGFAAGEREQILARLVRQYTRALELANVRFRVGSGDLLSVQQQQLTLYSAQVSLLQVQSDRLVQRVNLHLALGGSFDGAPAVPTQTSEASQAQQ